MDESEKPLLGSGSIQRVYKENGDFKPRNIVVFATCWLLYAIAMSSQSVLGPFFPAEAASRGASSGIVGGIFSVSPLCVTIVSPVLGYYLHQFGMKFALVAGTSLMGASAILFGLVARAPSGPLFISLCFFLQLGQGLGCAMLTTSAYAQVGTLFHTHFGMFMGFLEFAGGLGYTLGPLIGGTLYHLGGFELPFFVTGGALLLFFVPLCLLIEPRGPDQHQYSPKIAYKLLRSPMYLTLILCDIIAMAGLFVFVPILSPYLLQKFTLDPSEIGVISSVDSAFYMLLGIFAVPLFDRCGIPPRPFIAFALITAGVGYVFIGPATFLTTPQLWITVLGLAGAGFGCALTVLLTYLDMMNVAKELIDPYDKDAITAIPGLIAGTVASSLSCGELVGPLLGGVMREKLDFPTTTTAYGGVLVTQGVLLALVSISYSFCKRTIRL